VFSGGMSLKNTHSAHITGSKLGGMCPKNTHSAEFAWFNSDGMYPRDSDVTLDIDCLFAPFGVFELYEAKKLQSFLI
jgi:hypothetical protein